MVAIFFVSMQLRGIIAESPVDVEIEYQSPEEQERVFETLKQEKQSIEELVNQMLGQARVQLRNAAVNEDMLGGTKEGGLSSNANGTNSGSAYDNVLEENNELQRRIAETKNMIMSGDEPVHVPQEKMPVKKEQYNGPSVMSYKLDKRQALDLPVPVYQCETGGVVVVKMVVAQRGSVTSVSIDAAQSASDECLHEAAKRAAMLSKFSVSDSPKSQEGTITYRFVAQ